MFAIPKTRPVRDLQRDYRAIIDEVKTSGEPMVLISNSVPDAVLLDVVTYNNLIKDYYAWDEEYTLKKAKRALRSFEQGKGKVLHDVNDLDK